MSSYFIFSFSRVPHRLKSSRKAINHPIANEIKIIASISNRLKKNFFQPPKDSQTNLSSLINISSSLAIRSAIEPYLDLDSSDIPISSVSRLIRSFISLMILSTPPAIEFVFDLRSATHIQNSLDVLTWGRIFPKKTANLF